jgi:uncharacterized protein DUF5077
MKHLPCSPALFAVGLFAVSILPRHAVAEDKKDASAPAPAEEPLPVFQSLGDFGTDIPVERADMPTRGILTFAVDDNGKCFAPMEHWEQYNFPFKAKRWGKYSVRITYTLKSATLGVMFKLGETQLKKTLTNSDGVPKKAYLGEVYLPEAGDQFMALYTPGGVGWTTFNLHEVSLVPAPEGKEITQEADGTVNLLARDATTWSENMRYEPKPEKNCLGFWSDPQDFAEWEIKVEKPGRYQVTVHQGCKSGGSEVAVLLNGQKLNFKVQDTGDFHKLAPVTVGEVKIDKPGTYRLAVKPEKKNGGAIMDIQKVVLAPLS